MPFIEQLAEQGAGAAGNIVGAGLGLALGAYNDKRQLKQQQKLQNMQIQGQQQMGEFNRAQQMKLWEETNYSAQMAQLKKAGLNPGLIYGMGGGAGGSTQAQAGSISGGQAPSGGGEAMGLMGMAQQTALIQAQTALAEAQKGKVTEETKGQSIENDISEMKKEYEEYTLGNKKSMSDQELSKLRTEVQILFNEHTISDLTVGSKVAQEWGAVKQMWLDQELTRSNIGLTDDKRVALAQEVANSITALEQKAYELEQGNRRLDQGDVDNQIKQQLADWQTSYGRLAAEAGIDLLGKAADALKSRGAGGVKTGTKVLPTKPLRRFTKSQMKKDVLK